MKKRATTGETRAAFWRKHVEAWTASGETAAAYAKREGLAIQSLYQAKHRMAKVQRAVARTAPLRNAFARIQIREPQRDESAFGFRVRLASGTVLEWTSTPATSEVAAMLEQFDRRR